MRDTRSTSSDTCASYPAVITSHLCQESAFSRLVKCLSLPGKMILKWYVCMNMQFGIRVISSIASFDAFDCYV